MKKDVRETVKEFDWLEGCVSCNKECCHNTYKFMPANECARPMMDRGYVLSDGKNIYASEISIEHRMMNDSVNNTSSIRNIVTDDYRPLECRLFPFDVKDIEGKLVWIKWNDCHATPKLDYEKFIGFFERKFSRELSLDQIRHYVTYKQAKESENSLTREFMVIREINWPSAL